MGTTKVLTNEERKAKALAYSRFMIENKKYSHDETEKMLKDPHSKLRQHLDEFQRLNNFYTL
jgi:hypothetical protein